MLYDRLRPLRVLLRWREGGRENSRSSKLTMKAPTPLGAVLLFLASVALVSGQEESEDAAATTSTERPKKTLRFVKELRNVTKEAGDFLRLRCEAAHPLAERGKQVGQQRGREAGLALALAFR